MQQLSVKVAYGSQTSVELLPGTSSLGQIRESIAAQYSTSKVELFCNSQRVANRSMNQAPPVGAELMAFVTPGATAAAAAQPQEVHKGKRSIPPKPIIMTQDMEAFNVTECLCEIFDNSIRAGASSITVESQSAQESVATLRCCDNGRGMDEASAINFMRLAHTDSGIVTAVRERGKPLALAQYFSKELSRHGKGALALLWFGNQVTTITKLSNKDVATKIKFNYKDWLEQHAATGQCNYEVDVFDVVDLAAEGASYTDIEVGCLKGSVAAQLADNFRTREITSKLADTYHFFIHGMGPQLWSSAPAVLKPPSGSAAAGRGRPQGGLKVSFYGYEIGRQISGGVQQPRLATMLRTHAQLQEAYGHGTPQPFWLPIRWVDTEGGLAVDDVPSNVTTTDAFANSNGRGGSDPAGRLRNVHRDFLLCLLYFPMCNGKRTKPVELQLDSVELCLFAVWAGRLIPGAACMRQMPALVAAATQFGSVTFKLSSQRLCGLLFCSPENYTTNHKTNFQEVAFSQAMQCGSTGRNPELARSLFVWNDEGATWASHTFASILLASHFDRFWRRLESDGVLLDAVLDPETSTRRGIAYQLANRTDPIKAGQLVKVLHTAEEKQAADAAGSSAAAAAAAPAGAGGAGRGGGRRGGGRAPSKSPAAAQLPGDLPSCYRLIVAFEEFGPDSGTHHKVLLREWTPSWAPPGYKAAEEKTDIASISPLAGSNKEADELQAKMEAKWLRTAPHHLAWVDTAMQPTRLEVQGAQLTLVRAHNSMFAPSQVPQQLTACFATSSSSLAGLERGKWGSSLMYNSTRLHWTLARHGTPVYAGQSTYRQNKNGVVLEGLREQAQEPGDYCLTVKPDGTWIPDPLTLSFKVVVAVPATLRATWEGNEEIPTVQLGNQIHDMVICARNADGEDVAMQLPDGDGQLLSMLNVSLRPTDPSQRGAGSIRTQGLAAFHEDNKKMICFRQWRLPLQKLALKPGQPKMHVTVHVSLKLPGGGRLELEPNTHPGLFVVSGPPARIEVPMACSAEDPLLFSRGCRLRLPKCLVLDAEGNPVDIDTTSAQHSHCAALTIHPPKAIQQPSADVRAAAVEIPGSGAGGAAAAAAGDAAAGAGGGGGTGGGGARRGGGGGGRRARRAAAGGAAAAGALAFPCKLDGNVIEFQQEVKWYAAPGERASVEVAVYAGAQLQAAMRQRPLASYTMHVRMHAMHAVLSHAWIADLESQELLARRRQRGSRARSGREQQQDAGFTGEAYELNTYEACPDTKLLPDVLEANLEPRLAHRLLQAYEARRDILAGRAVDVFITPDGAVLKSTQAAGVMQRQLPQKLVQHWNGQPKFRSGSSPGVLRQVFVLSPAAGPLSLSGISIDFCDEKDEQDDDFFGAVKVVCAGANPAANSVLPDGVETRISGGRLDLPAITLRREWFSMLNGGTCRLQLVDVEDEQQQQEQHEQQQHRPQRSLDEFFVRLAPYAEQLHLLPAGRLFEGALVHGQFAADWAATPETRRLLRQEWPQGAASSSNTGAAGSLGAWAPWRTRKDDTQQRQQQQQQQHFPAAGGPSSRAAAERERAEQQARDGTGHLHPRGLMLQEALVVRLGEPLVLHFVALDLARCPVALTAEQAGRVEAQGLTVEAAAGAEEGTTFEVQAEAWSWAPANPTTPAQQLPPGHLGGLMVNAVTCRLTAGNGPALLKLHLQGSAAQPTVLELALQVEAGPVAPDGLWLRQVTLEPPQQAAAGAAAGGVAAAGVGQQLEVEFTGVLQDRLSWEFMPEVKAEPGLAAAAADEEEDEGTSEEQEDDEMHDAGAPAAAEAAEAAAGPAAAAARIEPDPQPMPAQQQQQHQPECIELLDSDDEVKIVEAPPQQQLQPQPQQQPPEPAALPPAVRRRRQQRLSARARQLAALSPASAALLYQLPALPEGSVLRLAVQLRDAAGQEISADRPGKLRLMHHRGWQQQQQQQGTAEEVQFVSISKGKAELQLRIGIGDAWLGEQLFEIAPAAPATQLAAAAGGSELSKALPVLLRLSVVPGNHPSQLKLKNDLAAAAAGCFLVTADQAAAAAAPAGVLQQYTADNISASLGSCVVHGNAAAAGPVGVLMLLQDESAAAAAAAVPSELPGFSVGITSRDGQPLPLQGLAPLQLQLLKWQPPLLQQQQGAALDPSCCWVPVAGCSVQVTATLPTAPDAAAAAEGAEEGQLPGEDADTAAAAAAEPEYMHEPGCIELPRQAGLYKLVATYMAQQQRGRAAPGPASLFIGPFLLLPAEPSRLVRGITSAHQQQQQQQQSATSVGPSSPSGKRGLAGRRGKAPTTQRPPAAPATSTASAAATADMEASVVLLEQVGTEQFPGEVLQLQDAFGNPWTAAAAGLAAAAAAAAPEEAADAVAGILPTSVRSLLSAIVAEPTDESPQQRQPPSKRLRVASGGAVPGPGASAVGDAAGEWRLQLQLVQGQRARSSDRAGSSQQQQQQRRVVSEVQFDAEGCCRLAAASLQSLGISSTGEYALHAVAVKAGADAGKQIGEVLLARYHIVNERRRAHLVQQREQLNSRVASLSSRLCSTQQQLQQLQQQHDLLQCKCSSMQQAAGTAAAAANTLREAAQRAAQQLPLENAPAGPLPRMGPPGPHCALPLQVGLLLLHPRVVSPAQQLLPAPQDRVNQLLGNSQQVQLLIERQDVLAPLVCLGATECPDVARCLAGYVSQRDLATLVAATIGGAQALRQARVQCFNLSQNEAVQYFVHLPHLHAPNQQHRQNALQQALQHAGAASWMYSHPQQLVPPSDSLARLLQGVLKWAEYDPSEGFVGFGINLLRMTPQQLAFTVAVRGIPNGDRLRFAANCQPLQLGLRHTMWAKALSNLLVFESEVAIQAFRERLEAAQGSRTLPGYVKLVALDGSTYNMRAMMEGVRMTMPTLGHLVFAGTAQDEVLPSRPQALAAAAAAGGPLDLRLRHAMGVARRLQTAQQELQQQQALQQQKEKELQAAAAAVTAAQAAVAAAQQQQASELPQVQANIQQVDSELQQLD